MKNEILSISISSKHILIIQLIVVISIIKEGDFLDNNHPIESLKTMYYFNDSISTVRKIFDGCTEKLYVQISRIRSQSCHK